MGYVYKITNTVNNKAYIGISIHEPEKGRIRDHLTGKGNRIIANAVEKYGKDAFTYEILEANVFDEFLPDLEVAYIANYNTIVPNGYNLTHGGDHAIPSEETRRRRSVAATGKKQSEEHIRKRMKKRSMETRNRMSLAHRGENNHFFGKKHTEETRRKMSVSQRLRKDKPQKPHTIKTKRKLSKLLKGNKNARLFEYEDAQEFFYSLSVDISLKEKRKMLCDKFPNIKRKTIESWVRKWAS